ncbi:MAG TPA: OsmC family protein [Thermoanaerobaculia bacterium]
MSTVTTPTPRNGVNVPALFATLDAVKGQRDLAKFQFRATNRWIAGTHSRTTIRGFYGAGGEQEHKSIFMFDGDHPTVLVGQDKGPTPIEYLLVGLLSCLTAGIGNIAAARGVDLTEVESTIEGDINLLGLLGIDGNVRNGYEGLKVTFRIKGNASEEELRKIVARSKDRSAVYDVLTNGVPIDIAVLTT